MQSLFGLSMQPRQPVAADPLQAFSGLISGTGTSLQQNITSAFGQMTPQQALSGIVQRTQQEADLGTPEGLIQLANNLNQLPQFSGMALAMRQEAAKLGQETELKKAKIGKYQAETTKALREQGPFGKVNPADFTPSSLATFNRTGNYADLVPVAKKTGEGTEFERLVADLPPAEQAAARQQRLKNLLSGGGMSPSLVPIALKEADAVGSIAFGASEINSVLSDLQSGKLKLGLKENFVNSLKTLAGKSDEGSRSFSRFNTALETLRNARLNLNVGVQTEGDAVRAANEFLANFDKYDTQTALTQLQRVFDKMSAAQKSKETRLRALYQQSGIELPKEFFTTFSTSTPSTAQPVRFSDDVIRREFNDPKNAGWQSLGFEEFKKAFLQQNPGR